ncbi:hypothetical protein [Rubrobacter aplysinae]|uniref:hypothetical protein n=1 Tax=Rubrobacter aplysinae TaxID=909625 RepID=UPI00064B971E|nr:hypothetical protein [Rubrobacter aplysinae]
MREWLYKKDEKGGPRRFLSHRELAAWDALKVGRFAGPPLGLCVVATIFDPQELGRLAFLSLGLMLLAFCVAVVAVMYLYVALSGGVMGPEERLRYRERLRESRRGRW